MINEFRGKYFFLSNFYEVPVTYRGGLPIETMKRLFRHKKLVVKMNVRLFLL